jgi:TfoX/Sxy family transcriptional regulator of competence genes
LAYDEGLAERVREAVANTPGYSERKMFGGLCFMVNGNMFAGIVREDLMVRLGQERMATALAEPGVRPMDFTGRAMKSMVYVQAEALTTRPALTGWLDEALAFVSPMPAKVAKDARARKRM